MGSNIIVKLENVSKYYKLYDSPKGRLKEALHPFRKKYHKEFYALNNISFELKRGECLGVIGKNGMGKSTLLKLIAHIIEPSFGTIQVNGTVSALLELGTGFNPEFTGLENIYFYGTILGFKKQEIERKVKEIVDFADIGEFIDQPVKTYSSGMFVRLAFAVQTSLKPDILIVDEVLSVGDIFFQQKCHSRIEKLLSKGASLIIVSHDMQLIEKYSTNVVLLENGTKIFFGHPHKAIQKYFSLSDNTEFKINYSISDEDLFPNNDKEKKVDILDNWLPADYFIQTWNLEHFGNKASAEITRFCVCNSNNKPSAYFNIGDKVFFYYEVEVKKEIGIPVGAVILTNARNIVVHGKDTLQYPDANKKAINFVKANSTIRFIQEFKLNIAYGEYTFSIGFGTVDPNNITKVNTVDYSEREIIINSLTRIPQAGKLIVKTGNVNANLLFHGYADLEGDFNVFINPLIR
ncbi:MAG: ABC transporter ATP-binding protein [Ignavibacteriales bacterium]|nr:ABC transporter ATP-binding protein [Ignavibacteriales bacterium]